MLTIKYTSQFKKDFKQAKKRKYDLEVLKEIISKLINEEVLEKKYNDHSLIGKYKGFIECHLKPDWLMIYMIDKDQKCLILTRVGSHSDLFQ